jgi:hypothetical protein
MSFEDSQPMNMKAQPSEGIFITNEQAKAVNVLLAAAQVAQKAGAFSLSDANAVFQATQTFRIEKPEEVQEEAVQEAAS